MDEAREVGQAHAQFHEYAITPTRLPQSLRALRLSVAETRGMQRTHRRVRRTVLLLCGAMDNFALRYRDWRRGIVALLGRFLPRLGPLFGAAFFCPNGAGSLGGDSVRHQIALALYDHRSEHLLQVIRERLEGRLRRQRALIHVERAIDFDLKRMAAQGRLAIVLGDEAARVGLIAADRE